MVFRGAHQEGLPSIFKADDWAGGKFAYRSPMCIITQALSRLHHGAFSPSQCRVDHSAFRHLYRFETSPDVLPKTASVSERALLYLLAYVAQKRNKYVWNTKWGNTKSGSRVLCCDSMGNQKLRVCEGFEMAQDHDQPGDGPSPCLGLVLGFEGWAWYLCSVRCGVEKCKTVCKQECMYVCEKFVQRLSETAVCTC